MLLIKIYRERPFMKLQHRVGTRNFTFSTLKDLLAKASPRRSADELAGIAAETEQERVAAQMILADLPLREFLKESLIPGEEDEVTRLIFESHSETAFAPIASLTVGEFREYLLNPQTNTQTLSQI